MRKVQLREIFRWLRGWRRPQQPRAAIVPEPFRRLLWEIQRARFLATSDFGPDLLRRRAELRRRRHDLARETIWLELQQGLDKAKESLGRPENRG